MSNEKIDTDIDLDLSDDFEVEIVDDTPEQDRDKARRPDGVEAEIPEDDEIASYSESVQKRIKKLRYEFHEERRGKEEAKRMSDEAIRAAQKLHEDNLMLRRTIEEGEGVLINQAKQRLSMQLQQVKSEYTNAYEIGDANAIADAQMKMTELKNEEYRLNGMKPRKAEVEPSPVPQKMQEVPRASNKALDWHSNNNWYGNDRDMTAYALRVSQDVISEGVDPESNEYYNRIDDSIRRVFPEKFAGARNEDRTQRKQVSNVVAPGGRQTNGNPRKITLSSTQVSLAKRLGLTPQQYAAQLLKDSSNG
jgi:hypothetical protein